MQVFITGASGYVGGAIVERLAAAASPADAPVVATLSDEPFDAHDRELLTASGHPRCSVSPCRPWSTSPALSSGSGSP